MQIFMAALFIKVEITQIPSGGEQIKKRYGISIQWNTLRNKNEQTTNIGYLKTMLSVRRDHLYVRC